MQLQVKDAAGLFQVSEKTIYRWIADSGLPAYKINTQYRFNRLELLEWAAAHRVNISPAAQSATPDSDSLLPGLADALSAGGVFHRVGGKDKESVLREVVELMKLPDSLDREMLLKILLEREALGSTAIGEGIAIPHVRNPIVLRVSRPAITLCFLETPIDFHALDNRPVDILFTLATTTTREHLHVLARLGHALRDPGFKSALVNRAVREVILDEARRVEAGLRRQEATGEGKAA
jgi:PTS system nitrogen regulatory IIA component